MRANRCPQFHYQHMGSSITVSSQVSHNERPKLLDRCTPSAASLSKLHLLINHDFTSHVVGKRVRKVPTHGKKRDACKPVSTISQAIQKNSNTSTVQFHTKWLRSGTKLRHVDEIAHVSGSKLGHAAEIPHFRHHIETQQESLISGTTLRHAAKYA